MGCWWRANGVCLVAISTGKRYEETGGGGGGGGGEGEGKKEEEDALYHGSTKMAARAELCEWFTTTELKRIPFSRFAPPRFLPDSFPIPSRFLLESRFNRS